RLCCDCDDPIESDETHNLHGRVRSTNAAKNFAGSPAPDVPRGVTKFWCHRVWVRVPSPTMTDHFETSSCGVTKIIIPGKPVLCAHRGQVRSQLTVSGVAVEKLCPRCFRQKTERASC